MIGWRGEKTRRKVEGKGAIDGWIKGVGASAVFSKCTALYKVSFRHTLLAGSLSRPPRSRLSLSPPGPLVGLSPSFLSPSFLSAPLRLSLFLSPTADFSPVTDPEVEPLEIFFPVLVPLLGPLLLIFLSGEGGAESLDPTGRLIRAIPKRRIEKKRRDEKIGVEEVSILCM